MQPTCGPPNGSPRNPVPHFHAHPKTEPPPLNHVHDKHEKPNNRLESVHVDKAADKRTLEGSARLLPPPSTQSTPRDVTRDASLVHAPVSNPAHGAIPHPAPAGSHSHSPALPNNPPNLPALPSYTPLTASKKPRPMAAPASTVSPSPLSIGHLTTPAVSTTAPPVAVAAPPSGSQLAPHPGLVPNPSTFGLPPLTANPPYPSYPPLYAPYSATLQHSPYLPPRVDQPVSFKQTRKLTFFQIGENLIINLKKKMRGKNFCK